MNFLPPGATFSPWRCVLISVACAGSGLAIAALVPPRVIGAFAAALLVLLIPLLGVKWE